MTEYIIQYQPDTRDLHTRIYESILAAKSTSLSQLLTGNPGCPYTTLRTLKSGTVLPLLDFHVRRLLHGATALHPHANHSPQPLRELLIALLRGILPHGTGCSDEFYFLRQCGLGIDSGCQYCTNTSHIAIDGSGEPLYRSVSFWSSQGLVYV